MVNTIKLLLLNNKIFIIVSRLYQFLLNQTPNRVFTGSAVAIKFLPVLSGSSGKEKKYPKFCLVTMHRDGIILQRCELEGWDNGISCGSLFCKSTLKISRWKISTTPTSPKKSLKFLDASSHLYERVRLSVWNAFLSTTEMNNSVEDYNSSEWLSCVRKFKHGIFSRVSATL